VRPTGDLGQRLQGDPHPIALHGRPKTGATRRTSRVELELRAGDDPPLHLGAISSGEVGHTHEPRRGGAPPSNRRALQMARCVRRISSSARKAVMEP
jgi:hypothetical protein